MLINSLTISALDVPEYVRLLPQTRTTRDLPTETTALIKRNLEIISLTRRSAALLSEVFSDQRQGIAETRERLLNRRAALPCPIRLEMTNRTSKE